MVISGCRLACLGGAEKPLHGGARRLEPPGDFVRRVLQRAIAGKRAIQFHGQAGAVVLENGNRLVALRPTGIGLRTRLRRLLQEIESTRKPLKRSIDRVGAGRLCHHSAGIRPRSPWRVNLPSGAIPCDQQGPSEPLALTGGGDLLSGASLAILSPPGAFPPFCVVCRDQIPISALGRPARWHEFGARRGKGRSRWRSTASGQW